MIFTFAIYVLVVARITRLINADVIMDPVRLVIVRAFGGAPRVAHFLTCPWCISVWAALALAWWPLYHPENTIMMYLGLAAAASHLVGMQAPLVADDAVQVEYVDPEDDEQ